MLKALKLRMKLIFDRLNRLFFSKAVLPTASFVSLILVLSGPVGAETAAVMKSRELLLKNDRAAALLQLQQALRVTPATNPRSPIARSSTLSKPAPLSRAQRGEVLAALRETREIFLTERGQAQYSIATSVWLQKPRDAIQALEAAQAVEKGNSLVAQLTARALLRLQDCARARREVQTLVAAEGVSAGDLSAEAQLLQLQLQFCAWEQDTSSKTFRPPQSPALIAFEIFIKRLVFRDAIRRRDLSAAQAAISAWEAVDPKDPELWWAKWRFSRTVDAKPEPADGIGQDGSNHMKGDANAGRKYISMCADLPPRRRGKYELDPELCDRVSKVESELRDLEQKP